MVHREFVACVLLGLCVLASAGTTSEGLEWLEENSKKEGVVTTSSGIIDIPRYVYSRSSKTDSKYNK